MWERVKYKNEMGIRVEFRGDMIGHCYFEVESVCLWGWSEEEGVASPNALAGLQEGAALFK